MLSFSSIVPVFGVSQRKNRFNQRYDLAAYQSFPHPITYPQEYDLRIIAVRHGERVDTSYGEDWYKHIFHDEPQPRDEYYRDNRLPTRLPRRNPTFLYILDPPITRQGEANAIAKGQRLMSQYQRVDCCFSSPAARSVLTADAILRGMRVHRNVKINIDPFIFEPMKWNTALQQYQKIPPCLATNDWVQARFNIDYGYYPLSKYLDPFESEEKFYIRTQDFFTHRIEPPVKSYSLNTKRYPYTPQQPYTILIVGHAATPVVFSRVATQRPFDLGSFVKECERVNFLGQVVLYRHRQTGQWVDLRQFTVR